MGHVNIEIKARCARPDAIRRVLQALNADFKGIDHQIDTYFRCAHGRLKLREGTIECALIHYDREDAAGPKHCDVILYHPARPAPPPERTRAELPHDGTAGPAALKAALAAAHGILTVVDKQREIYFIDNVKFHIDQVAGLGGFVEIEAIDTQGTIGVKRLRAQCEHYINLFAINETDLVTCSYSDLLLAKDS